MKIEASHVEPDPFSGGGRDERTKITFFKCFVCFVKVQTLNTPKINLFEVPWAHGEQRKKIENCEAVKHAEKKRAKMCDCLLGTVASDGLPAFLQHKILTLTLMI